MLVDLFCRSCSVSMVASVKKNMRMAHMDIGMVTLIMWPARLGAKPEPRRKVWS